MEQKGVVLQVNGKMVQVQVARNTACSGECGQSCGTCSLEQKKVTICAKNEAGAVAGDTVLLQSDSKKMLFYAFLVYIVPILAAVGGYYLAGLWGFPEDGAVLFALGMLVLAFAPAFFANHRAGKRGEAATAVRVLRGDEGGAPLKKAEEQADAAIGGEMKNGQDAGHLDGKAL